MGLADRLVGQVIKGKEIVSDDSQIFDCPDCVKGSAIGEDWGKYRLGVCVCIYTHKYGTCRRSLH